MQNNPQWSLDHVRALLAQHKRPEVAIVTQGGPYRAFIPEGEHVIRLLFDPQGELWRIVTVHHTLQCRTYCPDLVRDTDPAGVYPPCEICTVATQREDWRLQRAEYALIYGHLCRTSDASGFWRPGTTYLMIGRSRLICSLRQFLEQGVAQQPAQLLTMLNPLGAGPGMVVQVTKGLNGSVAIPSFTAKSFPPGTLGEWYVPLEHCRIGPEFNLGEYHAVLAEITGQQQRSQ